MGRINRKENKKGEGKEPSSSSLFLITYSFLFLFILKILLSCPLRVLERNQTG